MEYKMRSKHGVLLAVTLLMIIEYSFIHPLTISFNQMLHFTSYEGADKVGRPVAIQSDGVGRILQSDARFAAPCFDDDRDTFDCDLDLSTEQRMQIFPPVYIIHNRDFECTRKDWSKVNKQQKTKGGEFYQEVGFIKFFEQHYTNTRHLRIDAGNDAIEGSTQVESKARLFLPTCGFTEAGANVHIRKQTEQMKLRYTESERTVRLLETGMHVHPKRIFYTAPHPGAGGLEWTHPLHNTRALRIDQTSKGFYSDIMMPISVNRGVCNYERWDKNEARNTILYGCGREHKWSQRYKGYREMLPRLFNALNETGIDMSERRSIEDYREGFGRSKFCFVIPGDTTATSQSTRAMCAGCVPIFLSHDFRELPFANVLDYSSFSLRFHPTDLLRPQAAADFFANLKIMIRNGTYEELRSNVRIARDFYNYHQFGPRSPYGASLLSMALDDLSESQL